MTEKSTKLTVDKETRSDPPAPERWAPFDTLRHEIDRLFEEFTPSFWRRPSSAARALTQGLGDWPMPPAGDLYERDGAYDITAELPGIAPDAIEVRPHSQLMTVAAGAIAERKTFGQRSYLVATRRQSLSLPNMISIRLRRLYRRLSYFTVFLRCFRPGCMRVSLCLSTHL
ncbi:hypothetical protein U879_14170 [Defluviimonas sp. 20V17]|uniref:HSP20 family protein n=1 Tax=Allgaiera indica TaxID=765699 RepID=A0AAN4ZYR6_9RHOB|nr:hypothetical protein U879_14170 [Defluviimonas sp. 20V17]GHD98617.1 hypothetical protein GCM10008024_02850 [Allgaiera indica]SDW09864.1 HSP20 family protein [Allgaiera indica]